MAKPLALIINATDSPLAGIAKLVEARDCSVHVSRSIAEAERVLAAFPSKEQKFISTDLGVCKDAGWKHFAERLQRGAANLALICYDPQHPQALYGLCGHGMQPRAHHT